MGVYTRFKRGPEGFRALVELLESTPVSRRQKMIDVGMAEDPDFTNRALQYMFTFEDIIQLSDLELAEIVAEASPRFVAQAIGPLAPEVKERFLKNAKAPRAIEIRDFMEGQVSLATVGAAQLKLVEITRKLEKRGLIRTKHIVEGT
jgi:flagellar motor switch protein FliG